MNAYINTMNYLQSILSSMITSAAPVVSSLIVRDYQVVGPLNILPQDCVSFIVAAGTGCAWMCEYCASHLGTNNYYFPDGVCTYASGGCEGNPLAGHTYTCCAN